MHVQNQLLAIGMTELMEVQVVCVMANIWTYLKIDCYRFKYGTFEHHIISPVFQLGICNLKLQIPSCKQEKLLISFTHLANNRHTWN